MFLRKKCRELWCEFCDTSSMHGIRYMSERKRHWIEKIWWLLAISVSLFVCGRSIQNTWLRWRVMPLKTGFSEVSLRISDIPFPTVTICPTTKVTKQTFDLVSIYHAGEYPDHQKSSMHALSHLCANIYNWPDLNETIANQSIYNVIHEIAPTFSGTLHKCRWQSNEYPCTDLFQEVFTDDGLCFAFNALNSDDIYQNDMIATLKQENNGNQTSDWSLESGYKDDTIFPLRTFNTGYRCGLVVVLRLADEDLEYICQDTGLGFKIILNVPGETTEMSSFSVHAPLMENTQISIKPTITRSTDVIRKYTPIQRQCFFNTERQLQFYKIYTQNNCEAECLANYTKNVCGCVKFSMPRDEYTDICGASRVQCYLSARDKLFEAINVSGSSFLSKCNCWPACTTIGYDADVNHVKFDTRIFERSIGITNFTQKVAKVSIFYRYQRVETLVRFEAWTLTDFLAVCGGLLGLFLGVSVLSIVELIYFFTLRLFCSIRRTMLENAIAPYQRTAAHSICIDIHH